MYSLLAIRVEWVMIKKVTIITIIKVLLSMDSLLFWKFPSHFLVNCFKTTSSFFSHMTLSVPSMFSCFRELCLDSSLDIVDCRDSRKVSSLYICVLRWASIFLRFKKTDSSPSVSWMYIWSLRLEKYFWKFCINIYFFLWTTIFSMFTISTDLLSPWKIFGMFEVVATTSEDTSPSLGFPRCRKESIFFDDPI